MTLQHKFQAPKGTRDFYPADMAVRRYIESVWREVSINHGFEEVEGPTFEHLELYTHKSGPGIVSELFSFKREGGETTYALRPEFTPTLARMVAARAAQLPKPIKWFAIPGHYRAERPQRGRLREFFQWNVDFIDVPDDGIFEARCDSEVLAVLVDALRKFNLGPNDVRIKIGNRKALRGRLQRMGRSEEQIDDDLLLLDAREKIGQQEFRVKAKERGWPDELTDLFDPKQRAIIRLDAPPESLDMSDEDRQIMRDRRTTEGALYYELERLDILEWCEFDSMVIRGLAYYTGLIFEAHEAKGSERAVAGGGRYDKLIESFGGPSMPACGFGMGDVVLGLLLHDKGLLPEEVYMEPLRPHVFVIAANDDAAAHLPGTVARLRKAGWHVRHSYRATRNVGKLLGEAGKNRARAAIILDDKLAEGVINLKDLESGDQREIALDNIEAELRTTLDAQHSACP